MGLPVLAHRIEPSEKKQRDMAYFGFMKISAFLSDSQLKGIGNGMYFHKLIYWTIEDKIRNETDSKKVF